ncbi:trypsin-like peptidase domain-containing protein [Streptomyces alanosinicus]|uniref:Nephrocystin 3-like N-terminal domain-containing protein n=1 Tax=Streptomyces alanosinicus TaxID=68171 RepID=A0A918YEJ2_9ACTN|nr:trypsin-like peptidase domain-containing protein [Streptomyces alanosinicus]GHD99319.1 hypothetical protein GCM10010339_10150 [Streptomyces alanosinicus]
MTASAEPGLRPERVAEIIVSLPEGGGRRGTGYLVSAKLILTAAHVVDGAARIRARFQADRPEERTTEATVLWRHQGIDIALLALGPTESTLPKEEVPPVSYGRIGELDAVLTCTTLGFPRFKLRADDAGSRFRDAEHVRATCAVLSNRREGTLDLAVASAPPDDPDPERSPWEGMSGAPVFAAGRLVGVVARHHRGDGPGRLAASRVDRWADGLDAPERSVLEELLGRELRCSALPATTPLGGSDLVQEIYRAQLADIAPQQLEDRRTELDDLLSFCAGAEPYRWLQAPPWAGKTALAAWFALHPPRGVVPVWFFITARYAGQSDGAAYTEAVIDQLATIAGREPVRNASAMARDGERRLLLRQAAERVAERGGTLLLVVDGLDEDQSLGPGGSGTSIASLLPERPPAGVRVLVTSRTNPGIPADVGGAHPLRHCRTEKLAPAAAARHTEHEAKYDLQQALSGDRLQRDLVGLLTAARGALTLDDLRELIEKPAYELRGRLGSAFGRILRLRGDVNVGGGGGDSSGIDGYGYGHTSGVTLYASSRGYLFAHETLLAAAQDELGPDTAAYLERLHTWAETYERQGWPEHTPPYLLQPYGRLLAHLGETDRTARLATDAGRRERLRQLTGSDAACLAEIAAARENVHRADPGDLGALAALAIAEDLVARTNESLHPAIPEVYARLGRIRQAIGLARSVFRPQDRAYALVRVARVLAEAGDTRAVDLAEEAVELTEPMIDEEGRHHDDGQGLWARGQVATVLALLGNRTESLRRLRELSLLHHADDSGSVVPAYVRTATALGDRPSAVELLDQAEAWAEEQSVFPAVQIHVLASVADAWERIEEPGRAARLYDFAAELALCHADPAELPEAAEEALRRARPHQAARRTRLALSHADGLLRAPERLSTWQEGFHAVRALVAAGRADDAEPLAHEISARGPRELAPVLGNPWSVIAEGHARAGRAEQAWNALVAAQEFAFDEDDSTPTRVAGLLAEADAADRLEALLGASTQARPMAVAGAYAALARHFADRDEARCLRLLDQAQQVRRAAYGAEEERLAVFAAALARTGRAEEAERLVARIGSPDVRAWGYAAVSVALGDRDTRNALRCARRAARVAPVVEDVNAQVNVSIAIVQAWAWSGSAQEAGAAAEQLPEVPGEVWPRHRARALAAAGLWTHDPEAAGRLFDAFMADMDHRLVAEAAQFLAAALPHDRTRADRAMQRLLDLSYDDRSWSYQDRALACLVTATTEPAIARDTFARLVREWESYPFDENPVITFALVRAALHGLEAVHPVLYDTADAERSETLAHLAAYAAGVPGDFLLTRLTGEPRGRVHTALRLATLLAPLPAGPDLPRARALLAETLTRDGWQHALPILAAIDPGAVLRARDLVLTHLGLHE